MDSTILKTFGTGQVTLPKKWRSQFKTKHYKAVVQGRKLILSPLEDEDSESWKTLFDADEFNKGKGVEINAFLKALKKSLK